MISIIYLILSTIIYTIFGFVANIQVNQLTSYQQQQQYLAQLEEQTQEQTNTSFPSLDKEGQAKSRGGLTEKQQTFISDQIIYNQTESQASSQFGSENYVVEPVGDGFYQMHNAPAESMSTVDELNKAVNEFRTSQGRGVLEIDHYLCGFADKRAQEIADNFSHDLFSVHIDNGIAKDWGFTHFGENIWQGKFLGVHIVEYGWAKSPGHYGALVGDWTKGCAGIFEDNAVYIFAR